MQIAFPSSVISIHSAASTLKHHYGGAQVPLKVPSVCIGHDGLCCSHHCQPWASVAGEFFCLLSVATHILGYPGSPLWSLQKVQLLSVLCQLWACASVSLSAKGACCEQEVAGRMSRRACGCGQTRVWLLLMAMVTCICCISRLGSTLKL